VNTKYLNRLIDRFQPDVLHHTFNSDFHDISVPARLITINDLIREKTNLSSGRSNQTRRACELASRIICISEKTKQDVIELFGLSDEKCDVVHLAPSEVFRLDSRQFIDIDSKDPYLLYVGDRAGYKNFETLISAYAKSKFLNQNFRIVCFGGPRKSRADILLMNKYKISDARIHFLSGNDHELREVYAKASALIYPSLDEGFGIPPLEAMAAGCVTVCSNRGSLPEVLGNATSYFDAESAENLKANLEDLLTDKTKMLSLQNKGLNHSATYTWQNTAAKTVAVYRNALQMR
jgi:glycosyltransferase involved in cell wall biosynthesis